MRKVTFIIILLSLTICSQASIDIVIGYYNDEKEPESKESAFLMQQKFTELYSNFNLTMVTTVSSFVNVIQKSTSDTLIVILIGHGAAITLPQKQNELGNYAFSFNKMETTADVTDYYLVSKTLNYLVNKHTASAKLVILDTCDPMYAHSKRTNASWLFGTENNNITRMSAQLFTALFVQVIEKGDNLIQLQNKINEKYLNKAFYPQFTDTVIVADEYKDYKITYPIKSASVGNFTF